MWLLFFHIQPSLFPVRLNTWRNNVEPTTVQNTLFPRRDTLWDQIRYECRERRHNKSALSTVKQPDECRAHIQTRHPRWHTDGTCSRRYSRREKHVIQAKPLCADQRSERFCTSSSIKPTPTLCLKWLRDASFLLLWIFTACAKRRDPSNVS